MEQKLTQGLLSLRIGILTEDMEGRVFYSVTMLLGAFLEIQDYKKMKFPC